MVDYQVVVTAVWAFPLGYIAGQVHKAMWRRKATTLDGQLLMTIGDHKLAMQARHRQIDALSETVRNLNIRIHTFEAKALATSVKRARAGRLGAAATNAKKAEKRVAAVNKTLAALPSLIVTRQSKSGAGTAAA